MKGFSLLEVTVALSLFSIGMMGLLQQEFKQQICIENIYYKTIALYQCLSIRERLRIKKMPEARLHEINLWNGENSKLFHQGFGSVACDANFCSIYIHYQYRTLQCFRLKLPA